MIHEKSFKQISISNSSRLGTDQIYLDKKVFMDSYIPCTSEIGSCMNMCLMKQNLKMLLFVSYFKNFSAFFTEHQENVCFKHLTSWSWESDLIRATCDNGVHLCQVIFKKFQRFKSFRADRKMLTLNIWPLNGTLILGWWPGCCVIMVNELDWGPNKRTGNQVL